MRVPGTHMRPVHCVLKRYRKLACATVDSGRAGVRKTYMSRAFTSVDSSSWLSRAVARHAACIRIKPVVLGSWTTISPSWWASNHESPRGSNAMATADRRGSSNLDKLSWYLEQGPHV